MTHITQTLLGLKPYVLIEAKLGPDGADDLRMDVSFGGGPEDVDDAASMLVMALAELPGGLDLMRVVIAETDAAGA